MRGDNEYLDSMQFFNQANELMVEIKGETVKGKWSTMELRDDQHIIGVKGNMCEKYVRGIGFFVWSIGMGVPLEDEEEKKE